MGPFTTTRIWVFVTHWHTPRLEHVYQIEEWKTYKRAPPIFSHDSKHPSPAHTYGNRQGTATRLTTTPTSRETRGSGSCAANITRGFMKLKEWGIKRVVPCRNSLIAKHRFASFAPPWSPPSNRPL